MIFDKDEDEGAEERYYRRRAMFRRRGIPRRHQAWWLLHNVVVHPLLGFFPSQKTVDLHALTSDWLNAWRTKWNVPLEVPTITSRPWWLLHNVVAHVAIGLVPTRRTFKFHDWTAKKMAVEGWA